jgi:hypothetical protein
MLNHQLEWTQQLGFATQVQQAEVFDAIQRLRAKAQGAGNLQSTPRQIVRTEPPPGAAGPRRGGGARNSGNLAGDGLRHREGK